MRIIRFDAGARVLHWSHAIVFIWLLITGIWIFLTPKSLLGDPLIRMVHIYAFIPFIILPAAAYIFGSVPARKDVTELMSWTYDDIRWFLDFLKKNRSHVTGKFNGGQKANFIATLFLIAGLLFSGFAVWMKSMFGVGFVELNFLVHDFFAVLSLPVLSGHIIFTMYYSESLRGIIFGVVDEKWAKEHYPDWIAVEQKTKKND